MTDEQLAACRKAFEEFYGYKLGELRQADYDEDFLFAFSAGLAFRQGEVEPWAYAATAADGHAGFITTHPEKYPEVEWFPIWRAPPTNSPAQRAPEPQNDEVPDGYFDALSKAVEAVDKLLEQDTSNDPPAIPEPQEEKWPDNLPSTVAHDTVNPWVIPSGGADPYETHVAIREGHRNVAEDEYFAARPQIDSNDRRKVFNAGFDRGFDAAEKHFQAQAAQEPVAEYKGWEQGRGHGHHAFHIFTTLEPHTKLYTRPAPLADRAVEGWRWIKDSTHSERSWDEDFSPGRGAYSCQCSNCLRDFYGDKHRVTCKVCAAAPIPPAAPAQSEGALRIRKFRYSSGAPWKYVVMGTGQHEDPTFDTEVEALSVYPSAKGSAT